MKIGSWEISKHLIDAYKWLHHKLYQNINALKREISPEWINLCLNKNTKTV